MVRGGERRKRGGIIYLTVPNPMATMRRSIRDSPRFTADTNSAARKVPYAAGHARARTHAHTHTIWIYYSRQVGERREVKERKN